MRMPPVSIRGASTQSVAAAAIQSFKEELGVTDTLQPLDNDNPCKGKKHTAYTIQGNIEAQRPDAD